MIGILSNIWIRRSIRYFEIEEVTMNRSVPTIYLPNIEETIVFLDRMREKLGFPIVITSTYRSPVLNQLIGGVANSTHLIFCAIDSVPMSGRKEDLYMMHEYTHTNRTRLMGVGYYDSFLHIDHRGLFNRRSPATWGKKLGD